MIEVSKSELEDFVQSRVWRSILETAKGMQEVRQVMLLRPLHEGERDPSKTQYENEFIKGEVSGLALAMALPGLAIEACENSTHVEGDSANEPDEEGTYDG